MKRGLMALSDLVTFSTVARTGGITRAADELNTVQSNITHRVKALEAEIGTPLFERHSRGMTLTGAGRRLLPYAQTMASQKGRWRSDRWRRRPRYACHRCSPNFTGVFRPCG